MALIYEHLEHDDTHREHLRKLSRLMDSALKIPGTNFRFGLDAILDLLPVVGDAAGKLVSAYIILEAAQMDMPRSLLLRMMGNVLIDFVIGAFPFLGAIFGAAWRANLMNVKLIDEYFSSHEHDLKR